MAGRLPKSAQALIDEREPRFSPIAVLELTYLHEIGRARDPLATMLPALRRDIGLEVADTPFAELVQAAADLSWTRDPFDRLIAAHAIVANAPLITADQTIRDNLPLATWA
ncbi:MAG TPA: PIN domain-containing protein [Solirubrobacterales bacterium]|nr:PIN domain-containing protein [Solirubrobacterales bacterium]